MNKKDIQLIQEAYNKAIPVYQPTPDPEIETVFDMVLGDYLGAVGKEWDGELYRRFCKGIEKLAALAKIDAKKYDVDNLL